MSYALSMFCRRLLGRLVLVLAIGALSTEAMADITSSDNLVTVTTPGVVVSGGTQYTAYWKGANNFVVVRMRSDDVNDPNGNGPILAELVDQEFPSGARVPPFPDGQGTFTVPTGHSWRLWYFIHNYQTSTPGGNIGPFGDATTAKKINIRVTNTKDYAVKYIVTDRATGAVIATYTAEPGTVNHSWVVDVTAYAGPYDISMYVPSKLVDGVWEQVPLDDGDNIPVSTDVSSHEVPIGEDPTDTTPVQPPDTAPDSSGSVSTTIWRAPTAATTDNDRLDKATYKQGVDKITAALDPIDKSLKKLVDHADAEDAAKAAAATAATAAQNSATTAGVTASSAIKALYDNVGTTSQGFTVTSSGGPPSALTVAMPASFGGKTFSMNPFTSDRFGALASWFRSAVAWLAIVLLGAWLWTQVADWTRGFSTIRQASGNAVAGGTGAQATALVAAGLMTVAIVLAVTTLLAWSFSDITFPTLVTVMHTNPVTSMPADAFWMCDQLLPIATLIACLCARLSFNMYASSLFAGCAAVVRFIVP